MTLPAPQALNEAQWLQERRKGIGGSDIGVILGVSVDRNGRPYKTPYQLWLEKTGRSPPAPENHFMTAGKYIEPVIVQMWQNTTGYEIISASFDNVLYHHPNYPFIIGTPDRIFIHNNQRGILECKNTRMYITIDNLPKSWFCQIQWYMGLLDIQEAHIAWLVQGCEFHYHVFDFVPEFWQMMIEKAAEFWECIEKDRPPKPLNSHDIEAIFPTQVIGKSVQATEVTAELVSEVKEIRAKIKQLGTEESQAIDTLKIIMKDSEFLVDEDGKILATWQVRGKNRIFSIRK